MKISHSILSVFFVFGVALLLSGAVLAESNTNQTSEAEIPSKASSPPSDYKQGIVNSENNPRVRQREPENGDRLYQRLDIYISFVERVQKKAELYPNLESAQAISSFAEIFISDLRKFQEEIENATTSEELSEIVEKVREYSQVQKEDFSVLLNSFKDELVALSKERIDRAIEEIEKIIKILEVSCPDAQQDIDDVRNGIAQLQAYSSDLISAREKQDYLLAREIIIDAKKSMKEIMDLVKEITNECGLPY